MMMRDRVLAISGLIAVTVCVATPLSVARAQEKTTYTDVYKNVLGAVGLNSSSSSIDYSARPPLAVPPSNDLRPPVDGPTARLPAGFPVDPDVAARRRALADPRQPVPPTESGKSRAYLIEPPAAYLDAASVAATGAQSDKAETTAPAKHARRRKAEPAAQ